MHGTTDPGIHPGDPCYTSSPHAAARPNAASGAGVWPGALEVGADRGMFIRCSNGYVGGAGGGLNSQLLSGPAVGGSVPCSSSPRLPAAGVWAVHGAVVRWRLRNGCPVSITVARVSLGAVVGVFVLQPQFGGRFHLAGAGAVQGRDLVGPFQLLGCPESETCPAVPGLHCWGPVSDRASVGRRVGGPTSGAQSAHIHRSRA